MIPSDPSVLYRPTAFHIIVKDRMDPYVPLITAFKVATGRTGDLLRLARRREAGAAALGPSLRSCSQLATADASPDATKTAARRSRRAELAGCPIWTLKRALSGPTVSVREPPGQCRPARTAPPLRRPDRTVRGPVHCPSAQNPGCLPPPRAPTPLCGRHGCLSRAAQSRCLVCHRGAAPPRCCIVRQSSDPTKSRPGARKSLSVSASVLRISYSEPPARARLGRARAQNPGPGASAPPRAERTNWPGRAPPAAAPRTWRRRPVRARAGACGRASERRSRRARAPARAGQGARAAGPRPRQGAPHETGRGRLAPAPQERDAAARVRVRARVRGLRKRGL